MVRFCHYVVRFCHYVVRFCHYVTSFDNSVLGFHHDATRFDRYVLCLHFMWWGSFVTSSFSLCMIINTRYQARSVLYANTHVRT